MTKREVAECAICGACFEYYPSEKRGLYCGHCVRNEDWRTTPEPQRGADNPLWKGGKVELICPICNDTFKRYPSAVNDGTNLCSNQCRAAWLSDEFLGDGHPNWKGGGNEPYGKGWADVRRAALKRDGHRCVVCSKSTDEMGRRPDVHHIEPVRRFAESAGHSPEDAHRLDNVICLCIACHRKAEFGKIPKEMLRDLIDD